MIELLTTIFLIVGIGWFLYDIVIIYKACKKLCKSYADMTNDIEHVTDTIDDIYNTIDVAEDTVYAIMDDKKEN